jgi:serine/threonine protein kinase
MISHVPCLSHCVVRGDIKLFDLGLVKELHPNDKDIYDNYKLSLAGTPRYMAPEVAMHEPYNL